MSSKEFIVTMSSINTSSKMYLTSDTMAIDLTKLSQKGQVVIPTTVRRQLGLKEGMKFLVMGVNDTIVLRRLELSRERIKLKALLEDSRKKAQKSGFSDREIEELIQKTRKV